MPGFDGTGPQGGGPLTGRGGGFCILRSPCKPGEPATGFAGLEGRPVAVARSSRGAQVARLRQRVGELERAVDALRRRLAALSG